MDQSLDARMNDIVKSVFASIKPFGFKRAGKIARLLVFNNSAILAFQRSRDSTTELIKFTINLAIVSGILYDQEVKPLEKARDIDGHLRQRIGALLPEHPDKWWVIEKTTDLQQIICELSDIVSEKAIPFLLRYVKTEELLALWESGQAPGLTEGARVRLLNELKRGQ
jgi:hypothetical protein